MLAQELKNPKTRQPPGEQRLRRLPIVLAVAAAALTLIAAGCYIWNLGHAQPDWRTNAVAVKRGSLDVEVVTSGVVTPYNEVKISPKEMGLLKQLLVVQGQNVKHGELLAIMDDSNVVGEVDAARGAMGTALASYLKEMHGNRPQEIENSRQQMLNLESAAHGAQQDVKRLQAAVQQAQAAAVRDVTNAKRYLELGKEGAVSAQDALNAIAQGQVSEQQLVQAQKQLAQGEQTLQSARANLAGAQQQYSLMKEGFRQEDIEAAKQAYLQARGNLEYQESLLADTRIRAPFAGVITQKYTDEGGMVTPTAAAMTTSATTSSIVALAGRLELVASVAETDVEHITDGQSVTIYANAYPDKVFHAKVYLIAPEAMVTQNVTTFQVHATITDDPQHFLMSGMNVTAHFPGKQLTNVLLLPTVCIISQRGETGVLVPDQKGNPVFRPIKAGATAGTTTVVRSGLHEGDLVFSSLTPQQLQEQGYSTPLPGTGSGSMGQAGMMRGLTR